MHITAKATMVRLTGFALTMDGKINGKMILANSIVAESIDAGYRTSVETKIKETSTTAKEQAEAGGKRICRQSLC